MIRNSRGTLFHVAPRVWGLYPLRNPGHSKSQDKEFVRDGRFILEGKGTARELYLVSWELKRLLLIFLSNK